MTKSMRELERDGNDADQILPGLFLGNQESAEDYAFLKKNKITVVINASNHIPHYHRNKGITYIRVPVDDSLKVYDIKKMTVYLPYIVDTLRQIHHNEHKRVLVHCVQGMQRSAVIVAGYLVKYYNKTPMQAIKYIVAKRPIAFYNGRSLNFIDSLKEFHNNLKKFSYKKKSRVIKKKPVHSNFRKVTI